jgi:hypothetical protein
MIQTDETKSMTQAAMTEKSSDSFADKSPRVVAAALRVFIVSSLG